MIFANHRNHTLVSLESLHFPDPVTEKSGPLITPFVARLGHFCFEVFEDGSSLAVHEFDELCQHEAIGLVAIWGEIMAETAAEGNIKARFVWWIGAGANGKNPFHKTQGVS